MKKAFTIAEIMIVLTVIGILAGILVPVANNARPDENVMKFKKAHAVLGNVVRELVTSDKYFKNGDLGIKYDGTPITYDEDVYYCEVMADILSAKSSSCPYKCVYGSPVNLCTGEGITSGTPHTVCTVTETKLNNFKTNYLDNGCAYAAVGSSGTLELPNIVLGNDTVIYIASRLHFGLWGNKYFDAEGNDVVYGIICIDVDGIPSNATSSNCVNECPFGYGIRADGKLIPGARAQAWLDKSFQRGEQDN